MFWSSPWAYFSFYSDHFSTSESSTWLELIIKAPRGWYRACVVGGWAGGGSGGAQVSGSRSVCAGDHAEENQARLSRRGVRGRVTPRPRPGPAPPSAHAPPPAGHHAEEARQGAAPQHGAEHAALTAAAPAPAAARRLLNLAERAPDLARPWGSKDARRRCSLRRRGASAFFGRKL